MSESYKNNRAFLQVGEKGYFDDTTEAASAIFDMHEQIKNLEAQLLEREALLDLKDKRVEVLEAENERLRGMQTPYPRE